MRKVAAIIIPALLIGLFAAQFTACEKYVLPELEISTDTLIFSAQIDSQSVFVHTNTITTALPEDNAAWLHADPQWIDESTEVFIHVGHYVGSTQRTAVIAVKSESLQKNLVVIQKAEPDSL